MEKRGNSSLLLEFEIIPYITEGSGYITIGSQTINDVINKKYYKFMCNLEEDLFHETFMTYHCDEDNENI